MLETDVPNSVVFSCSVHAAWHHLVSPALHLFVPQIEEELNNGDEDEKKKVEETTAELERLTEWLEKVLGGKLKSTSKELMPIGVDSRVRTIVFTVLLCQLSHKIDSAEEECSLAKHFTPAQYAFALAQGCHKTDM